MSPLEGKEHSHQQPAFTAKVDENEVTGSQTEQRLHAIPKSLHFWLAPFLRIHQVPVFKRVWFFLAFMAVYTTVVSYETSHALPIQIFKDSGAAGYTSVVLGLLLVFRTNSAYERWWEGRKLWGQLVNDSRNLCLKIKAFVPVSNQEKIRFGELVIAFAFGLKHHLRDTRPTKNLPGLYNKTGNIPVAITGQMFETIMKWHSETALDGFIRLQLDPHLRGFMDICGACERIRSTPIAVSYRAFLRQGILLNLLSLPWFVPSNVSIWLSVPLVLVVAYFLIGLELIAEDIEDPFGTDGDDLPLDLICEKIRISISEILEIPKQQFTAALKLPAIDPLKDDN